MDIRRSGKVAAWELYLLQIRKVQGTAMSKGLAYLLDADDMGFGMAAQ